MTFVEGDSGRTLAVATFVLLIHLSRSNKFVRHGVAVDVVTPNSDAHTMERLCRSVSDLGVAVIALGPDSFLRFAPLLFVY